VYGSLKQGFGNHACLTGATYCGEAMLNRAKLLNLGPYPGMIPGENGERVFGEVYFINAKILKRLDMLEGHPNFYCREQREIFFNSDDIKMAWCYFLSPNSIAHYKEVCKEIPDGRWTQECRRAR
jgi:gamma-glutamylaminecyclotransferase